MTDAAGQEPAVLKSYPDLERRFWFLTILCISIAYCCAVTAVYFLAKTYAPLIARGIWAGLFGALGSLLIFGLARVAYVPRAFLKITLGPGGFVFDRDGRIFDVPYADVRALAVDSAPALFARLRFELADGRRVNVGLAVQGLERLVHEALAARPGLLAAEQAEALLCRVRIAEFRQARAYDLPASWPFHFLAKYGAFPIFFGVIATNVLKSLVDKDTFLFMWIDYWRLLVFPIVVVVTLALATGALLALAREAVIEARERARGLADLRRDLAHERRVGSWFSAVYFALGLAFYAAWFFLVMFR